MKKRVRIRWFNLFRLILMLGCIVLVIHDFIRVFSNFHTSYTWFGLFINIIAICYIYNTIEYFWG